MAASTRIRGNRSYDPIQRRKHCFWSTRGILFELAVLSLLRRQWDISALLIFGFWRSALTSKFFLSALLFWMSSHPCLAASFDVRFLSKVLLPLTDLCSVFQVGESHTPAQLERQPSLEINSSLWLLFWSKLCACHTLCPRESHNILVTVRSMSK